MTPMETPIDRRAFASLLATPFVLPAFGRLAPLGSLVAPKPITPPSAEFLKGLPRMMEIAGVPGVAMGVVKDGRGRLEPGMYVLTKPFQMDVIGSRIREIIEQ